LQFPPEGVNFLEQLIKLFLLDIPRWRFGTFLRCLHKLFIGDGLLACNGDAQIGDFGVVIPLCVFKTFLEFGNDVVFGVQFGDAFFMLVLDAVYDCVEHVNVLLLLRPALPKGLFL
jgi:hypothetical protein